MNFKKWLENATSMDISRSDIPFQVGNKNYTLRFTGRPTYTLFPYGSYAQGNIYEISWFPEEREKEDVYNKYNRTGDNSISQVRTILKTLINLIEQ